MKRLKFLIFCFLYFYTALTWAQTVKILELQFWKETATSSHLQFNLSYPTEVKAKITNKPLRLVLEFQQTELTQPLALPPPDHPFFKNLRANRQDNGTLRITLDLKQAVQLQTRQLAATSSEPPRFLVDVLSLKKATNANEYLTTPIPEIPTAAESPSEDSLHEAQEQLSALTRRLTQEPPTAPVAIPSENPPTANTENNSRRPFTSESAIADGIVIAIDAGHGGIDPGTIGKNGTKEKTVVFEIAKELANLINQQTPFKARLTRTDDTFLKLRQRIDIAREMQADLFISIHADAYSSEAATGASVYMLSPKGASSEAAMWLAEKENAADFVGGVSLNNKDDLLASVLLDLSQSATLEASARIGNYVLNQFKAIGKSHYPKIQQAAFMVLRSPDIPSLLIETGYLSNASEEQLLNTPEYRRKLAEAIMKGIVQYFN